MLQCRAAALVLAGGIWLAAGCGSDDAAPQKMTITVREDASAERIFIDAPSVVDAGAVTITLRNRGIDPHDAQIVRVQGNHSVREAGGRVLEGGDERPTPRWAHGVGGVAPVQRGDNGRATVFLTEGRYFIVDTYGGDPPHVKPGAVRELRVVGEPRSDLPSATATVTARDYGFVAEGLRPGRNRVLMRNVGRQPHHAVFFRMASGVVVEDVRRGYASVQRSVAGPPHGTSEADTMALGGGAQQVVDVRLRRGRYALFCLMSDYSGGPNHTSKGMVTAVDVR